MKYRFHADPNQVFDVYYTTMIEDEIRGHLDVEGDFSILDSLGIHEGLSEDEADDIMTSEFFRANDLLPYIEYVGLNFIECEDGVLVYEVDIEVDWDLCYNAWA